MCQYTGAPGELQDRMVSNPAQGFYLICEVVRDMSRRRRCLASAGNAAQKKVSIVTTFCRSSSPNIWDADRDLELIVRWVITTPHRRLDL